jgi:hypothetical protein
VTSDEYVSLRNWMDTQPTHVMWMPMHLNAKIGINASFMLMLLIDLNLRNYRQEAEANDGWFKLTVEDMSSQFLKLGSPSQQSRYLPILQTAGLIERKVEGHPVARYIRINYPEAVKGHFEWMADCDKEYEALGEKIKRQTTKKKRRK